MLDLLPKYIPAENRAQLADGMMAALAISFAEDEARGSRVRTLDEARRRAKVCAKVIDRLVAERWGLKKIVEYLPKYLRFELDRVDWKPDTRVLWLPGDGR